jgi:hypothetical protein
MQAMQDAVSVSSWGVDAAMQPAVDMAMVLIAGHLLKAVGFCVFHLPQAVDFRGDLPGYWHTVTSVVHLHKASKDHPSNVPQQVPKDKQRCNSNHTLMWW